MKIVPTMKKEIKNALIKLLTIYIKKIAKDNKQRKNQSYFVFHLF